jgi:hypothetical protein
MEPVTLVLLPGLIGGIVLALLIPWVRRRPRVIYRERPLAPTSPSLINMAHIHVEGTGGLGLVAMAAAVAIAQPGVRAAMILALLLGIPLGLLLIALRSRGPLPTHAAGAHAMLPLER